MNSLLRNLPKIYLHFRTGDEKGEIPRAHGLGHAYRCLRLLRHLEKRQVAACSVIINRSSESLQFVNDHKLSYFFEDEVQEWPSLWISDVNYLPEKHLRTIREHCLLMNLAPRGLPKYIAHHSFLDLFVEDYPEMQGRYETDVECGFHTLIFSEELERLKREKTEGSGVVVCMGGADASQLTLRVLQQLEGLNPSIPVRVITGRTYPFQSELEAYSQSSALALSFLHGSDQIYGEIAQAKVGIFAGGLTMYEALFLGIPSVNLSITAFHQERIDQLVDLGVILDSGRELNKDLLETMLASDRYSRRASELFNENGLHLITAAIARHLQGKRHFPSSHLSSAFC